MIKKDQKIIRRIKRVMIPYYFFNYKVSGFQMTLSVDDVKCVSNLAYIDVNEDEAQAALTQLTEIFTLIETMQAVDTSSVEPMSHAQNVVQRLREDRVTESDQRDLYQSIAPQVEAGIYLVPKVIE